MPCRYGHIGHAVDHDGRGFLTALRIEIERPRRLELRDVVDLDLIQTRITLGQLVATMGQPVLRFAVGTGQACIVDLSHRCSAGGRRSRVSGTTAGQQGQSQQGESGFVHAYCALGQVSLNCIITECRLRGLRPVKRSTWSVITLK